MASLEDIRKAAHERLPGYMVPGLLGYIERGEPVGGFLSAVLSNDLRGAFERADSTNERMIGEYLRFLYNFAPAGSWGSKERFENWQGLEKIGLIGERA